MTQWNTKYPVLKIMQGVDRGYFQYWNTDFVHTYLGMPKSDLKQLNTIPVFLSNQ